MDKKDDEYAVYKGRNPGKYNSLPEAQQQVDNYPGNCYVKLDPVTGETPIKFYVVHKGRQPGVYDSWPAAHQQVVGYPGASYEKADSFDDAHERFIRGKQGPKEVYSGVSDKDLELDSGDIGKEDEHTNEDEVDDGVEDFSDGNDDVYCGDDFDDGYLGDDFDDDYDEY